MDDILDCMDENILLEKFKKKYEEGDYSFCATYIEKKLSAFSSKFYDIMVIYLNSLINTNQKEKALKLVKEELSMPYIPMNFEDKFLSIYKEIAYIEKEGKEYNLSRDKIEEILLVEEDKNLIILAIVELCKLNIRDFYDCIKEFLKRDVKNIFKVMLIDALRGQGVNEKFIIKNNGIEYEITPSTSQNVLESKEYLHVSEILNSKIGNKEMSILSGALENLMLYMSDIFPMQIKENEYNALACALHYYVSKMFDESIEKEYFAKLYGVDENDFAIYLQDLETACSI